MKKIKDGAKVRMNKSQRVPVRYQGRSGFVVGTAKSSRGTDQLLVEFPGRKATPLQISERFASAV